MISVVDSIPFSGFLFHTLNFSDTQKLLFKAFYDRKLSRSDMRVLTEWRKKGKAEYPIKPFFSRVGDFLQYPLDANNPFNWNGFDRTREYDTLILQTERAASKTFLASVFALYEFYLACRGYERQGEVVILSPHPSHFTSQIKNIFLRSTQYLLCQNEYTIGNREIKYHPFRTSLRIISPHGLNELYDLNRLRGLSIGCLILEDINNAIAETSGFYLDLESQIKLRDTQKIILGTPNTQGEFLSRMARLRRDNSKTLVFNLDRKDLLPERLH